MSEQEFLIRKRVLRLARFFYRVKGRGTPRNFGPGHPQWVFFDRLRYYLINAGLASDWKTYVVAQFDTSPDPSKIFPSMLCHSSAVRRYEARVQFKSRRFGHVYKAELLSEPEFSVMSLFGHFTSSAWYMRQYEREGFSLEEMFKLFSVEFHPMFVVASREGWIALQGGVKGFHPMVYRYFNRLQIYRESKRQRILSNLRIIYDKALLKDKATH